MKVLILAESTARQSVRQPLLFIIVAGAALMILLSKFFTFFTFGNEEQLNMMREMGLATITMSGLLYTVFASSLSITDELEMKSAMTILCKPIKRYEFILGKFLGIALTSLYVYLFLTICLFFTLWISETTLGAKEILSETAKHFFTLRWGHLISHFRIHLLLIDFFQYCSVFAPYLLRGIVLSYFEILLLNAISLAIATRLPILINLALCSSIFVIGNLSDFLFHILSKGVVGDIEQISSYSLWQLLWEYPVMGIAKIIYLLIPNLESFNISSAVAYNLFVSPKYVLLTVAYSITYTTIALLTALVSFEHRELT